MKINLKGLLKDGYTFICPIHGLHPNCDCQDNQIKVWNDNIVNPETAIKFADWWNDNIVNPETAIKFADWCNTNYNYNYRYEGTWFSKGITGISKTTEELFEIFKKEQDNYILKQYQEEKRTIYFINHYRNNTIDDIFPNMTKEEINLKLDELINKEIINE